MVIAEFRQVAHPSDSRNGQIMYPPREHDFDSFPPAVKRKYFSSLERLRLAQRPVTSDTCTTSTSFLSHTRPVTRNSRPKLQTRNSSYFKNSPGRLMRKTSAPSDCFSFEDAQWFQSLPDKVQRKQFTTEEQQALARRRRESLILDAADEVILKAGRQRFHSVPTIQPFSSCSSASSVHTLEDVEDEHPVDSAIDMDESILDSFRWMDDDDDLDLTLDDYHSHLVSSTAPASRHGSRRHSFRRTLSLTGMPAEEPHRSASSERDPRTASSTPLPRASPRTSYHRDGSRPRTGHRDATSSRHAPLKVTDQPTKHYQDPEARLKLRVYLASPSKFDEALEFGFPSLESTDHLPQPRRPSISRQHHTEPALQTFYDSENPSFLDSPGSDSDDAESLPEMDAPHTPSDPMFFRNTHRLPVSKPTSSDLDRPLPKANGRFIYKQVEQAHHQQPYIVSGCNREMTLRMTLTRPDLRASDDLLYGPSDSDPLALEHLPTATGGHDIWDQGKDSGGAVRKLWRKVSGR
ncbi:MAG: hypothetical protein Q9210_003944 [Variospora velana]